ncbi:MAG: low-affinity phosphate transporter [Cirrosporium novae-zelandiae]|nr:MAG: low-affinity phosphate transporter [Cirrosporium novae-zelandiae]
MGGAVIMQKLEKEDPFEPYLSVRVLYSTGTGALLPGGLKALKLWGFGTLGLPPLYISTGALQIYGIAFDFNNTTTTSANDSQIQNQIKAVLATSPHFPSANYHYPATSSIPTKTTTGPLLPRPSRANQPDSAQKFVNDYIELQDFSLDGPPRDPQSDQPKQRKLQKRREKLEKLVAEEEMKFSHSIQFNAVPDWSNNYIAYSNLKKLIYILEKQINQSGVLPSHDAESSPLLSASGFNPDEIFKKALDNELEKVCSFYQLKELEVYAEFGDLIRDEEEFEIEHGAELEQGDMLNSRLSLSGRIRQGSVFRNFGFGGSRPRRASTMSTSIIEGDEDADSEDEDDETTHLHRRSGSSPNRRRSRVLDGDMFHTGDDMRSSRELPSRRRLSQSIEDLEDQWVSSLYDTGASIKKRTVSIYVTLCELKSFIQLNKTGFRKALKKYDKILNRDLRMSYMDKYVAASYPFQQETMNHLEANIAKIESIYATLITKGDISAAKRELRLHLREHVVWERNTVWREMIGIERKAEAAKLGVGRTLLADNDPSKTRRQGDDQESDIKELVTPIGKYRCPSWLFSSTMCTLIGIMAVFVVLLNVKIMETPEQQNCLAMLIFVSMLWATEVIPLFVTSLLVPFLVVTLRIMRTDEEPYRRLDTKEATQHVFAAMWTPVIMLLLGGFTIAAALSKYQIAKLMATFVLSKAGTRPRTVLVTNMFVAMIASMWISNVAAPVLCFSIIQPILRNLPADSNFSKALILGIALSSNIGGAASPIASPQNIIALQNMSPEPSWGVWFFIALPVCIITILLIWVLLLVTFNPSKGTTIVRLRPVRDRFSGVQWFISIVTLATIILWCVTHQLEPIFGDMGVVAIIPLVLFFGTGILTKEDFNNFLWTIIILAAGGLALGKAVSSSGLLQAIASAITARVQDLSMYSVMVVFAALILVVATFISHTVAALIILPLVQEVGAGMKDPHPNLLVMGSAIMCSAAMGLPTSGFPNMTAIMMEVPETGQRYLRVRHFISRGIPSSAITFAVVITLGYGLMLAVGM